MSNFNVEVSHYMSSPTYSIDKECSLEDAHREMTERGCRAWLSPSRIDLLGW